MGKTTRGIAGRGVVHRVVCGGQATRRGSTVLFKQSCDTRWVTRDVADAGHNSPFTARSFGSPETSQNVGASFLFQEPPQVPPRLNLARATPSAYHRLPVSSLQRAHSKAAPGETPGAQPSCCSAEGRPDFISISLLPQTLFLGRQKNIKKGAIDSLLSPHPDQHLGVRSDKPINRTRSPFKV